MTTTRTTAERLDAAVDLLAAGLTPGAAASRSGLTSAEAPIVEAAARVGRALAPPPVAPRFEARLGARLAGAAAPRDPLAWALRHPGRLIVTGAVGSAFGVGVTAYAVWRSTRRSAGVRLLSR